MSKFSGLLIFSGKQISPYAKCTTSTFNGEENNVANPEHPTSVLQMRNACKNVMYTVVSSWAYDGEHEETGMENWKKAGIGIDIVIALFMAGMEVLVIRGYKKRKNAE